MNTISELPSNDPRATGSIVRYEEIAAKPPPVFAVGPLAWVRNNLFLNTQDTILTLLGGTLAITTIVGIVNWAVTQANWFIVMFNLRQLLMGRYEPEAEWRLTLILLISAFIVGVLLAAWARLSRRFAVGIIVLLGLAYLLPVLIDPLPLPPTYITAGDQSIVSGSSTEATDAQWGFIARAGETVHLRLAVDLSSSDEQLRTLHSFADIPANLLRAAAETRLSNQVRIEEINRLFAEDVPEARILTDVQRTAMEAELGRLTVPEPVIDTYAVNQTPIAWRLVRGSTFEVVAEGDLLPDGTAVDVILPEDGWYIFEKTGTGIGLIEANGIYPLLERSFTSSAVSDESGAITQQAGRYSEYVRMTDSWSSLEVRPKVDGRDVPMAVIIDTQYRGQGTFSDWLTLYVGPFLKQIKRGLLWTVVAGMVGFAAARVIDRWVPARGKARNPRILSQRASIWLFTALPIILFVLAYGVGNVLPITDTRKWGGLLLTIMLTMVGILASFPLGILLALGRRSKLPVVSGFCTIYIETVRGVPLIAVLFMAQLLVPLVNPVLAEIDNVFRAMIGITLFSAAYLAENVRGGLQAIPFGQEEAAKALGLAGWQVTLFITLPQALRLVIPVLVGQCISLFKDTSLVAIVGLTDLLGIGQASVSQTEFLGLRREVYIFVSIIYFVFSYIMGAVSRRLEASGSGASRMKTTT
ncbi:MAG: amino acid ABC transporter permease [Anaerolineae bacterium]